MTKKYFKHLKTNKTYLVIDDEVVNATNKNDGQKMVIYFGRNREDTSNDVFVREYSEFHEKFKHT